ncbi:MAG: hypothetical protein P1V20_25575 [Verrucomicrobiales bacterium]|nr:hypothetical protein [Verrucomicrobiales bacterium]
MKTNSQSVMLHLRAGLSKGCIGESIIVLSAILLVIVFPAAAVPFQEDKGLDIPIGNEQDFRIYRSAKISIGESLNKLANLKRRADFEIELLVVKRERLRDQLHRVRRLSRMGHASAVSLKQAQLLLDEVESQIEAERNFAALLAAFQKLVILENFIDAPPDRIESTPQFHLRIPGLSLRAGGVDFFTARMPAKSKTTLAIGKYIESRLERTLAYKHSSPSAEFFQNRHDKLEQIPGALQSELKRSRNLLNFLDAKGRAVNSDFASRIRAGRRIGRFDEYVAKREHNSEAQGRRSFVATPDSFWLFGDGLATAVPSSEIAVESVALVRNDAASRHEIDLAKAKWEACNNHFRRLSALEKRGYSNGAEVKRAKLRVDIASYDAAIANARREVAARKLEQLKSATSNTAYLSRPVEIPSGSKIDHKLTEEWLRWFVNGPTADIAEVFQFLNLIEAQFQAVGTHRHAEKSVEFQNAVAKKFARIRSVQPVELEKQRFLQNEAIARLNRASIDLEKANLKLQQWARFVHRKTTPNPAPDEKTMEQVVESGMKVIQATQKVARLKLAKAEVRNVYDRNRLYDLMRIRAVTKLEVLNAENNVRRSSGMMMKARRDLAVSEQRAKTLRTLCGTGCLQYSENGLSILRITPEAVTELGKLASLIDGVDQGEVERIEADLADCRQRIVALNGLVAKGYASPVEVNRFVYKQKSLENELSVEQARKAVRASAEEIISSLEQEADPEPLRVPLTLGQTD